MVVFYRLRSPQHLQHKASRHFEEQGSNTFACDLQGLPHMTLSTVTIQSRLSSLQQLHTNTVRELCYSAVSICICARFILTRTGCIVASFCLYRAAYASSAPLLWWRVVAETHPCDVASSTRGCTCRPRRPKAPVPTSVDYTLNKYMQTVKCSRFLCSSLEKSLQYHNIQNMQKPRFTLCIHSQN